VGFSCSGDGLTVCHKTTQLKRFGGSALLGLTWQRALDMVAKAMPNSCGAPA
jgi:hypothetical protein